MIFIVNSLISSCLEYGVPLFYDSPPSAIRILETSYNAAICLATSLPVWTPLPVLHRKAYLKYGQSSQFALKDFFMLHLLSSWSSSQQGGSLSAIFSWSFLEMVGSSARNRRVSGHSTSTQSPVSLTFSSKLPNAFNHNSRFSISRWYITRRCRVFCFCLLALVLLSPPLFCFCYWCL